MPKEIFTDWKKSDSKRLTKEILTKRHSLAQDTLFGDEALEELFDTYPRENIQVYTMTEEPCASGDFLTGDPTDLCGRDYVELIKNGHLWIQMRQINRHIDSYKHLVNSIFDDLKSKAKGFTPYNFDCGLLISSPKCQVFYHLDVPMVMLVQLRGKKCVSLYPPKPPFFQYEEIERITVRDGEEEFNHKPEFEEGVEKIILEPGMLTTWPQYAPHRVQNVEGMNVSLSIEFMTPQAQFSSNVIYANAILRRRFGFNPTYHRPTPIRDFAKFGFARFAKVALNNKSLAKATPWTFAVDKHMANGVKMFSEPMLPRYS